MAHLYRNEKSFSYNLVCSITLLQLPDLRGEQGVSIFMGYFTGTHEPTLFLLRAGKEVHRYSSLVLNSHCACWQDLLFCILFCAYHSYLNCT